MPVLVNGISWGEIDGRLPAWSIREARFCLTDRDLCHGRCGHSCHPNSI